MWPFTPRYLKNAKNLLKGVTRFINYKRDILPVAVVEKIETLRTDLKAAIKAKDEKRIDELEDTINKVCNKAMPDYQQSAIGENVEVFFVAIVIALGIRAYIAQPFQIPTGSMQPTLNGFRPEVTKEDPTPNFLMRAFGFLTGDKYVNVIADRDGRLDSLQPFNEVNLLLTSFTSINWADGHSQWVFVPLSSLENRNGQDLGLGNFRNVSITKGQVLARGIVHAGDHVLVNKFIYHFFPPKRGDVFVFTTRNISDIDVSEEEGSQHYIKRLVGTPGDHVQVKVPEIWIDGKPAEEPGLKRVAAKTPTVQGPYPGYTHIPAQPVTERRRDPFTGKMRKAFVPDPAKPDTMLMRDMNDVTLNADEYMACGDNSDHSFDSRYWGTVKRRNVVGSGMFCYFPFTWHWGPIH
jgi:signal peptidase I